LFVILADTLLAAPAGAAELGGTLKKIKDSGAITIGYREQSNPISFLDEAKKPVGYSLDLCARVVDTV
jgi:glutamate/aspartate transport system substrate-binding protein